MDVCDIKRQISGRLAGSPPIRQNSRGKFCPWNWHLKFCRFFTGFSGSIKEPTVFFGSRVWVCSSRWCKICDFFFALLTLVPLLETPLHLGERSDFILSNSWCAFFKRPETLKTTLALWGHDVTDDTQIFLPRFWRISLVVPLESLTAARRKLTPTDWTRGSASPSFFPSWIFRPRLGGELHQRLTQLAIRCWCTCRVGMEHYTKWYYQSEYRGRLKVYSRHIF